jgi:hypothetical protein
LSSRLDSVTRLWKGDVQTAAFQTGVFAADFEFGVVCHEAIQCGWYAAGDQ